MTRAMRVAARAGEQVLRVGLVRDGRVIEERKLRRGQSLSVGSSERCDFVLSDEGAPRFLQVFSWTRAGARLLLSEQLAGRIVGDGGAFELGAAAARGRHFVEIESGTRGKVVIGSAALLFQLVLEAPAPARPQLPLALQNRPIDVDWRTTIFGAFSFLLHFAVIGSLYSEWADPVIDDGVMVSGLVDSFLRHPPPPLEDAEHDPASAVKQPDQAPPSPERGARQAPGPRSSDRAAPGPKSPSTSEQAALDRDLEALELATVGTLVREGVATRDVLRDGDDLPIGSLDAAARDSRGVSGPGELAVKSGRALRPGTEAGRLGDLGDAKRGDSSHTGTVERPRGPAGNVSVAPPAKTGAVPNAERVISGLRGAFRQCYQRGLDQFPDAEGSVRLTFSIGPNGEPTSVSAAPSGNLPSSVVGCIRGRAANAQFDAPEGGSAVVVAPVILRKQ